MLHAWWCPSVNAFKFQSCDRTFPVVEVDFSYCTRAASTTAASTVYVAARVPFDAVYCTSGLHGYLIRFAPPTFALDQRERSGHVLSP